MNDKKDKDALVRVREARHQISERFDHDPKKLVEHYMKLQQDYKDRVLKTEKEEKPEASA